MPHEPGHESDLLPPVPPKTDGGSQIVEDSDSWNYNQTLQRLRYRAEFLSEEEWYTWYRNQGYTDRQAREAIAYQKTVGMSVNGGLTASEQQKVNALKSVGAAATEGAAYNPQRALATTGSANPAIGKGQPKFGPSSAGPTQQALQLHDGGKAPPQGKYPNLSLSQLGKAGLSEEDFRKELSYRRNSDGSPKYTPDEIDAFTSQYWQPRSPEGDKGGPTEFLRATYPEFGKARPWEVPGGETFDVPNALTGQGDMREGFSYGRAPAGGFGGIPAGYPVPAGVTTDSGQFFSPMALMDLLRQRGIDTQYAKTPGDLLRALDADLRFQSWFERGMGGAAKPGDYQKLRNQMVTKAASPTTGQAKNLIDPTPLVSWAKSGSDVPFQANGAVNVAGAPSMETEYTEQQLRNRRRPDLYKPDWWDNFTQNYVDASSPDYIPGQKGDVPFRTEPAYDYKGKPLHHDEAIIYTNNEQEFRRLNELRATLKGHLGRIMKYRNRQGQDAVLRRLIAEVDRKIENFNRGGLRRPSPVGARFAGGGAFMTNEPIIMMGMYSGQPKAVAGEPHVPGGKPQPERIIVEPMNPPGRRPVPAMAMRR